MRVSVMTIGGRELASIDEDCTRKKMFTPVMASEQFLPLGKFETVSFADTTFVSIGLRVTRSRARLPERLILLRES